MAHESGPHRLLTIDQLSSRPGVPSLRPALSGRSPAARFHLLGPVSGDGLRPVDLSRESARHRSLFGFVAGQAVHLGFHGKVARSTLADANESRDWRIFADFAHRLIATARGLYARESMESGGYFAVAGFRGFWRVLSRPSAPKFGPTCAELIFSTAGSEARN